MAKKKSTGTVTELRDEIDGYQLSAVDGLDRIIAILNGWAHLLPVMTLCRPSVVASAARTPCVLP